jgi:hypothetical protein
MSRPGGGTAVLHRSGYRGLRIVEVVVSGPRELLRAPGLRRDGRL